MADIIIIGAGAAGLMAGKILSENGHKVRVLEARNRIGGRIHTLPATGWGYAAEAGAEFVHGKLAATFNLMQQSHNTHRKVQGKMWQVLKGDWQPSEYQVEEQEMVENKLKALKEDISMADFLDRELPGEQYEGARQSLMGYVEGYYSADARTISAKTFLSEWQSEQEEQYRPSGGYYPLMEYLANVIKNNGGAIHLDCCVKKVDWDTHKVKVADARQNTWQASRLINTIPLGVWQAGENEEGFINYSPGLPHKTEAAKQMGFGWVIKTLIRFNQGFYQQLLRGKENTGFIFSDTEIPTWWTQYPLQVPVLTGWLAGPKAAECGRLTGELILRKALKSLEEIFAVSADELRANMDKSEVINWTADPFTRGAYAFSALGSAAARPVLRSPVDDTLFFAGEALYEGTETGTVEAALTSGREAAHEITRSIG